MCGILGVRRSFLDDEGRYRSAVAAMAWRGPDGVEEVVAGDWRLTVARLTITDPSHGQPLWSADRRRVIAFNGTVTSAVAERTQYHRDLVTGNDAELPLHRLATGGIERLVRTAGHFALAIIEPATDRLWLTRDPEGEKPLFVVRRGTKIVAFASNLASLRTLGLAVEFAVADQARFFRFGFGLQPALGGDLHLDADVRGVIHQSPSGIEHSYPAATAPLAGAPFAGKWQLHEQRSMDLRAALLAATDRCATAAVPVGLCLSGGVDSACLAAALVDTRGSERGSLGGYQFRAVGAPGDERRNAQQIAQHTGLTLRPVDAGPALLQELPALTNLAGMPLGDPSVLAVFALAQTAAADGVKVLLSGEGADELFLGYRRHRAALWLPARPVLPRRLRLCSALSMSTTMRWLRALAADPPYDSLLEVAPPGFRTAVFEPEFAAGTLSQQTGGSSSLARARVVDRSCYLREDLLPKLDTGLLAAGIEGRCPFLDPAVVHCRAARAVDPRSILGKRHLRAAFAEDLPAGALAVRKRGFAVPLDRWLRTDDFLPDLLCERRTAERSHLRPDGLSRMLDLHRSGRKNLGHALYLVAAMELHRRDVESRPVANPEVVVA